MNFGIIIWNQNMVKIQTLVIWVNYSPCVNRWYLQSIAEDVKTRFDTSNYETEKPLPKGKNRKVIGIMKDGLEGQVM